MPGATFGGLRWTLTLKIWSSSVKVVRSQDQWHHYTEHSPATNFVPSWSITESDMSLPLHIIRLPMGWRNWLYKHSREPLREWEMVQFRRGCQNSILMYRLMPHSTTGIAPAEMLLGCRSRSVLDNLDPDPSNRMEHKPLKQKLALTRHFKAVAKFQSGTIGTC